MDVFSLSYEEIEKIDFSELTEGEIEQFNRLRDFSFTMEQAIKVALNTVYGAFGSNFFQFYNTDVAEAITLEGQNLIKYTNSYFEKYFLEYFHKDTEVHKFFGWNGPVKKLKKSPVVYNDTDSGYFSFQEAAESVGMGDKPVEFVLGLDKIRLSKYIKNVLNKYATDLGTENLQDFELETIAYTFLIIAKKMYAQNLAWKDGVEFEDGKIKITGLEIVRSTTPYFIRDKLKESVEFILKSRPFNDVKYAELVRRIREIKNSFKLAKIDSISKNVKVSDYSKYVLEDNKRILLGNQTPIHVRAAAVHNWYINQNPKLKNKYELIKSGDKIKFYPVANKHKDDVDSVFAFKPGSFPVEIAPKIDYDAQFYDTFLKTINRYLEPTGKPILSQSLTYAPKKLF